MDFKEKAKAKTDTGIHESAATNGDANTSATVANEETNNDEILESQVNDSTTN